MFYNFLNEIASHGFMIIANGRSNETALSRQTSYKELISSADWVMNNPAAKKYGNLDTSRLVVAGQSCGGMEAVSSILGFRRFPLIQILYSIQRRLRIPDSR